MSKLQELIASPSGIAALEYVRHQGERQRSVLRGAGCAPSPSKAEGEDIAMGERRLDIALEVDLERKPADEDRLAVYRQLAANAMQLKEYARALIMIASAAEREYGQ